MEWIQTTLRTYPDIAIFLSLCAGYWVGGFRGFSLGAVTGTLLAAIIIGQLDITVSSPIKSVFFLLFLFVVGYGIGPQFVWALPGKGCPRPVSPWCSACTALPFRSSRPSSRV